MAGRSTLEQVRAVTGTVRPPGTHGCKLVEVVPGLFTAHFHDFKEPDSFVKLSLSPAIGLVINTAVVYDQCPTGPGFYKPQPGGPDIEVLPLDVYDDPFPGQPHTQASDAKQYFNLVNQKTQAALDAGQGVLIHCMASISRSAVYIIAYLMWSRKISAAEATAILKAKWGATWPNDSFTRQLLAYEAELADGQAPPAPTNVPRLSTFAQVRSVTGYVRPPGTHGCKLVEVVPGLFTAHFNDFKEADSFVTLGLSPAIGLVVNTAVVYGQCPTGPGYYKLQPGGPDIEVLPLDVYDDPFPGQPHTQASDAKQYFNLVNQKTQAALDAGQGVLIHCMASISRSAVYIIAYLMWSRKISAAEATAILKAKWGATWPNDSFTRQLLAYEAELAGLPAAPVPKRSPRLSTFEEVRAATGWVRPPGAHGCKLVEVVPGLFTAHFNDFKDPDSFVKLSLSPAIGLVVNTAVVYDQCPTGPGFYKPQPGGPDIQVLPLDVYDDPFPGQPHTQASDAKQYFNLVNQKTQAALDAGQGVLIHCMASISRSAVFIIAYLMWSRKISAAEATAILKAKWGATWPNDSFTRQLLAYEAELLAADL